MSPVEYFHDRPERKHFSLVLSETLEKFSECKLDEASRKVCFFFSRVCAPLQRRDGLPVSIYLFIVRPEEHRCPETSRIIISEKYDPHTIRTTDIRAAADSPRAISAPRFARCETRFQERRGLAFCGYINTSCNFSLSLLCATLCSLTLSLFFPVFFSHPGVVVVVRRTLARFFRVTFDDDEDDIISVL